jgi:RNA polymerase sigma factor (sigma-70 family)
MRDQEIENKIASKIEELEIHVRSKVFDLKKAKKVLKKSLERSLREYDKSIGDNYLYTWLEEISDSEIYKHSIEDLLPKLKTHARFKVHNQKEVEDLVSKTILKALEKEEQFDGENLLAWMKTIMGRLLIDELRRTTVTEEQFNRETEKMEKVYTKREEQISELTQPYVEGEQVDSLVKGELETCLEELKQENREIILMKNKGFSYKEISKKFNKEVNNLKQINLRSIQALQICMGA